MTDENTSIASEGSLFDASTASAASPASDAQPIDLTESFETLNIESKINKTLESSNDINIVKSTEPTEHEIEYQTTYKDSEFEKMEKCMEVIPFVAERLEAGSVIFNFPENLFAHRVLAYQLIEKEFGPVVNKTFIPLSDRYSQATQNLIILTRFSHAEATKNAVNKGITVDGVQYYGILYHAGYKKIKKFLKLRLTLLRFNFPHEYITTYIMQLLSDYGKVLEISKIVVDGYFEGEVDITLSQSSKHEKFIPSILQLPMLGQCRCTGI